ncbi:Ribosomal protein S27e [hydrothermal vent metagenome]|uniref:Ribosomal protein S27e n=1 Tax=hydrothermal vent metagenome TaxID=652676 RepID=A0A3B0YRA3_9ZZZZ
MKESDIRPRELMQTYVELSAKDAEHCFSDSVRHHLPCVACGTKETTVQFTKVGFTYAQCNGCGTLYQTPRPSVSAFEEFYKDSESSRYWAEVFFPSVAEARREKIFKPRVQRLASICSDIGLNVNKLIDVGAGYGIFLDEWRSVQSHTNLVAVEPSVTLAKECRNKGFTVVESIVEKVTAYDGYADLVVCFEVLEHVYDPLEFVNVLTRLVRPGGYVFVSTLCIDGFDLQTLWENSSQISPPHHINFLSVSGFEQLFERAGLSDIEVTTPGQLDVDIVRNALHDEPEKINNKFIDRMISDAKISQSFQNFLVNNKLSSHAWVIGKKK